MNRKQLLSCTLLASTLIFGQATTPPATGGGAPTGGNTPPSGGNPGGNPGGNTGVGGLPGNNPRNPTPFPQERQPGFDQMQNRPIFYFGQSEDGGWRRSARNGDDRKDLRKPWDSDTGSLHRQQGRLQFSGGTAHGHDAGCQRREFERRQLWVGLSEFDGPE